MRLAKQEPSGRLDTNLVATDTHHDSRISEVREVSSVNMC